MGASRFTGSLKKLSAAQALEFRSAQFVRGNVVIAANGISQERLGAVLGKTVGEIPTGAAWNTSALPFVGSDVKVRADLDGVSRVGLAFPVPAGEAGKLLFLLCKRNILYLLKQRPFYHRQALRCA